MGTAPCFLPLCRRRLLFWPPAGEEEGYPGGKQVRLGLYREAAAAGLGEGAGDGQAQAAASVGAAGVSPDEPFGQVHPLGQLAREIFRTMAVAVPSATVRSR